jgi:H+/Cl- antiporter ClcA
MDLNRKDTASTTLVEGDDVLSPKGTRTTSSVLLPSNEATTVVNEIFHDNGHQQGTVTIVKGERSNSTTNYENSDSNTTGITTSSTGSTVRLQYAAYDMVCAGIVGIVTGIVVAYFKLSIESVRVMTYSWNILEYLHNEIGAILIPIAGGIGVGLLIWSGPFSPGLRGKVSQVEQMSTVKDDTVELRTNHPIINRIVRQVPLLRKTTAAICTLGTGCSLGPEGPCVELGMGISRSCMDLFDRRPLQQQQEDQSNGIEVMDRSTWNRILLSCGAAAGVSAGFDAPVAGVFFVLEVIQAAFNDISKERRRQAMQQANDESLRTNILANPGGLFSSSATLSPVLLSSVLAALCARSILGDHLTFNVANTDALSSSPLIELPTFLLLGSICGVVAFLFSQSAKFSRSFFNGEVGNDTIRNMMQSLSPNQKPIIGGVFCGVTALYFPQILFFGYETLNSLLSNTVSVPTNVLLSLLIVKAIATAVCIGSGLVGGTLAPALFLGGVTGASFHNIISDLLQFITLHSDGMHIMMNTATLPFDPLVGSAVAPNTFVLADLPDYAMVGSASVLAALFRAPLTASLLLFELSRDYDVILPILASAGVGSVVADILEDTFIMNSKVPTITNVTSKAQTTIRKVRRDQDSASWGDLADKEDLDVIPNGKEHYVDIIDESIGET